MTLTLLRCGRGFRPHGAVEIELFPPRVQNFTATSAGQHQELDSIGHSLVLVVVQDL